MADNNDAQLEVWKAEVQRGVEVWKAEVQQKQIAWRAQFDRVLHMDRGAVDIGVLAVRTAILINAGAIIALLAFVGQVWGEDKAIIAAIFDAMFPFVIGLIAGALASAVAYIYQSFTTADYERALETISEGGDELPPLKWITGTRGVTAIIMIGLCAASYGFFIRGVFVALGAMTVS